jgi:hypothetical protein
MGKERQEIFCLSNVGKKKNLLSHEICNEHKFGKKATIHGQ